MINQMESPKGNFLKILNNDDIEKLYETSLNSYCSDNTNENINNEIPINKTNYQLYKQKFFNAIENKLTIDEADEYALNRTIDKNIYNKTYKTNTITIKKFDVLYYNNNFYLCINITNGNFFDLLSYKQKYPSDEDEPKIKLITTITKIVY